MDELAQSAANAHAHCCRAQVHLNAGNLEQAKSDIHTAMAIHPQTIPLPKSAWRILADAEEAAGDPLKAIEALQNVREQLVELGCLMAWSSVIES